MKLFGWKSAGRASSRPAYLSVPLHPRFTPMGHWPRGYEAQVRELYLANAVAQRAVKLVAEGVASATIKASDEGALALVKATSAGQSLMETLAAQLLLHGNGYVQMLAGADGAPTELYALRPERVSVEADARGWPAAFRYKAGDVATRLSCDEVIHIRTHHPLDDHYGLGCLDAASGAIAIHNASAKWNKALLDNAARPSGALVAGSGEPMSGEQFDRLKRELAEGFQGAVNAGRPMLLEGGLSWQTMSLSPADMDFAGLKAAAAREIALAFGVPPMLLGLPGDATYANYREANKALWRQAILPLATKMLDAISEGLRPWFAGLELTVDLDALPALSEDRERLWAQLAAADFLTLNEKREAIGLEALELGEVGEDEGEAPEPDEVVSESEDVETKFNPWHDPGNGQFANEGSGVRYGGGGATGSWGSSSRKPAGGGSFGGGGATGSWDTPKPKAPTVRQRGNAKPPSRAAAGRGGSFGGRGATGSLASPSSNPSGGGSFGGGGTTGNWDKLNTKTPPAKPKTVQRKIPSVGPARRTLPPPTKRSKVQIRTVSAGEYKFDIDDKNRTVKAYGQLRLQPGQRRSRSAQSNAGRPDRQPKDHGGHYIGRRFGGPEIRENHFAQNSGFNLGKYRSLENEWSKAIKPGKGVKVDIRSVYKGNSKRPSQLRVRYQVNGRRFRRSYPNKK